MREEYSRHYRRRGFSLVELLIVLSVVAALIAVIAPIGTNVLRRSAAVSAARDLKTLSNALSNRIYLDGELPDSIKELGRNIDSTSFGAAWKQNEDGEYSYFVFTNREVDFESVSEILTDSRQGVPFGIDDYAFLEDGLEEDSLYSEVIYYSLLGPDSVAPLTEFGSSFEEISSGLIQLIMDFFENRGSYPRDWADYRYDDLGLDKASWTPPVDGVLYKPSGRLLRVIPDSDHKFIFNFLDSSDKFELTSSYNWDLIFNIGDDSSDTGHWYLNSIEGRKVDISTLRIVKVK
ncbi:type II secretion system protein [Mesotoga sp. BH458_6_3_2_1]|uniref:type II secretion system protein n=1 Tax=Mesotoga sp. BH458_6_3_2_1 TaxID=1437446 RepID=UPI000EF18EAD|nr:type II secretion system protein [Mesotoga sp. BH458_6_3_2_1]RLL84811.1 N-terminal cleavage protein [Mesotoga sp. BH458_6_3_2_1]